MIVENHIYAGADYTKHISSIKPEEVICNFCEMETDIDLTHLLQCLCHRICAKCLHSMTVGAIHGFAARVNPGCEEYVMVLTEEILQLQNKYQ